MSFGGNFPPRRSSSLSRRSESTDRDPYVVPPYDYQRPPSPFLQAPPPPISSYHRSSSPSLRSSSIASVPSFQHPPLPSLSGLPPLPRSSLFGALVRRSSFGSNPYGSSAASSSSSLSRPTLPSSTTSTDFRGRTERRPSLSSGTPGARVSMRSGRASSPRPNIGLPPARRSASPQPTFGLPLSQYAPTCRHSYTESQILDSLSGLRNIFGRSASFTPSPPDIRRSAGGVVHDFYHDYFKMFGKVPDERGLTDQFIATIIGRFSDVTASPRNGQNPLRLQIMTCSQTEEARCGWDFEVSLHLPRACSASGTRYYCLVQAKHLHDPDHNNVNANLTVNFNQTSGRSSTTQLTILRREVTNRRSAGEYVVGGYLIYFRDGVWYLPLEDIDAGGNVGTLAQRFNAAFDIRRWGADGILKHIVAGHVHGY